MGSSPLTPKAGVPDFCNIVSQGFPGQHAWTVFVTPSGCLAAGRGQDGACPSPDTPLGSPAPLCPLGRLPAFREDGPWLGPGKGSPQTLCPGLPSVSAGAMCSSGYTKLLELQCIPQGKRKTLPLTNSVPCLSPGP